VTAALALAVIAGAAYVALVIADRRAANDRRVSRILAIGR
jgi:hypothetical protein